MAPNLEMKLDCALDDMIGGRKNKQAGTKGKGKGKGGNKKEATDAKPAKVQKPKFEKKKGEAKAAPKSSLPVAASLDMSLEDIVKNKHKAQKAKGADAKGKKLGAFAAKVGNRRLANKGGDKGKGKGKNKGKGQNWGAEKQWGGRQVQNQGGKGNQKGGWKNAAPRKQEWAGKGGQSWGNDRKGSGKGNSWGNAKGGGKDRGGREAWGRTEESWGGGKGKGRDRESWGQREQKADSYRGATHDWEPEPRGRPAFRSGGGDTGGSRPAPVGREWAVRGQKRVREDDDAPPRQGSGGGGGGPKKIKVTNIPRDLEMRDIKDAFQNEAGRITHCEMERGTARITFANGKDAQKAVETFDRGELNGKTITVVFER